MSETSEFKDEASEYGDGFGPEGEYGLGRSWGYSIEPPLTFKHLAAKLTFARRVMLFQMIVESTYDSTPVMNQFLLVQAEIDRTLSRYDKYNGQLIICHIENCSDRLFLKHLKVLMIDTGLPRSLNPEDLETEEDLDIPDVLPLEDFGQPILCTDPLRSNGCKFWSSRSTSSSSSRGGWDDWDDNRNEQMAASIELIRRAETVLPQELCDHFWHSYLAKFFGPRRRLFATRSFDAPEQRLVSREFYAAYETYKPRFLEDNIWVFDGEDFFDDLYDVFGTLDYDLGIRNAELVLSLRDTCFSCLARIHEQMTPIGQDPVLWGQELLEWDVLRIINRYRMHCGMVSREIIHAWQSRFNLLAQLPLEHFVLDMRETYSLDQYYLGVETARGFRNFAHGLPKVFKLLAPTPQLSEEIRSMVLTSKLPQQQKGGW
ncbi:MAG: hypothetical protein OHK93_004664 [Ramalina farinacea]|uniref:Uncharacterized protein n=1 Tax=Ramalina farinacea TaxID=258253 RepID=A0AA43QWZ7_9LECA|nr:hypothetical protein [Ramalina farinacea]